MTEAQRQAQKRYMLTTKGREAQTRANARYRGSSPRRAARLQLAKDILILLGRG